jgi:CRISPR system Cascade subunit CasE
MISVPVDLRGFRELAARRGLIDDEGRALHSLLCERFGKGTVQPFRLMVGSGSERRATLYAYTTAERDALLAAEDTAAPELLGLFPSEALAMKTMPQSWAPGRRLAFDVRVRPVRRLRQPVGPYTQVGAEVDAWLLASLHAFAAGAPAERHEAINRDAVYTSWLAERLAGAATLLSARLTRFERTRVSRNGSSEGPDATLHGELVVADGDAFARKLQHGVGRHLAYGFGMLLLRPAREA